MQPLKTKISFATVWTILTLLVTLLFCQTGAAGKRDVNFPVNLFEPAPGPNNFLAVESPLLGEDKKPSVGILGHYQFRPFVLFACDNNDNCGDEQAAKESGVQDTINNVKHQVVTELLFTFNFLKRFSAGLAVPFYALATGETTNEVYSAPTGQTWIRSEQHYKTLGLGDIRIHLKGRILGSEQKDGFALSAALIPALPMGAWTNLGNTKSTRIINGKKVTVTRNFMGSRFLSLTVPKLMASYKMGPLRAIVNAGFKLRKKVTYYSAEYGNAITYGGGLGYNLEIKPDFFDIEFFGEINGQKNVVSKNFNDMESAPLLFEGGARFRVQDFIITAGGGGGVISGVGVPQVQAMLGVNWLPTTKVDKNAMFEVTEWDVDGDGIDNDVDECKEAPEDPDGFQDEDGCPDTDNDNDSIEDGYDSCPNEPEDKDGFRDDDGCPDLDHDEDGIREPTDQCPNQAEDFDGFEDEDGCPEKDNDKDGVEDDKDFCNLIPEDIDQFEDEDGCPDQDNDMDGVPDAMDQCPNEAEVLNGKQDEDGCPENKKPVVTIENSAFVFAKSIDFKNKKAIFSDNKDADEALAVVAAVLKRNDTWTLHIEVNATDHRKADKNESLALDRAKAIMKVLIKAGVNPESVSAVGTGDKAAQNSISLIISTPAPTEAELNSSETGGDGEIMDFTEDDGQDSMDFTIEDDGESMDFSTDEVE